MDLNKIDEEFKEKLCWQDTKDKKWFLTGNPLTVPNILDFLHSKLKEAYEKGKEEERKEMYSDECLIIKKETRQETLEEVEKVIKEKVILKTDDKVVDIAILLFSEDILQQLNKMKEKDPNNS